MRKLSQQFHTIGDLSTQLQALKKQKDELTPKLTEIQSLLGTDPLVTTEEQFGGVEARIRELNQRIASLIAKALSASASETTEPKTSISKQEQQLEAELGTTEGTVERQRVFLELVRDQRQDTK